MINEYAYEVVLWISRPARLGEQLQLRCTLANVNTAELRFEEVGAPEPEPEAVNGYDIGAPEGVAAAALESPSEELKIAE